MPFVECMPEKPSIHNLNSQSTKLEKITPCFEVAAKWLEDILHENSHLHYTDLELAVKLDERDPLAVLREEFNLPKHPKNGKGEAVYLCGNSLGAAPKRVESILMQDLEVWAKKGVLGHTEHSFNRPWVSIDHLCDEMLARIVGAHSSEIGIMNSLSVNLQLLLSMFYRPKSGKYKIVMERNAFPSDHYVVQSCIQVAASLLMAAEKQEIFDVNDAILFLPGKDPLATGESTDSQTSNICIPDTTIYNTTEILDFIEEHARDIALILLPGVQYLTGQVFDIASVTRKAHQHNIVIGWDLAHAVGNIPLKLHEWDVDFAAWCSYKYLNAGPGAISGFFLNLKYHKLSLQEKPFLTGWWGNSPSNRFEMSPKYTMIKGSKKLQLSNPSVFSILPLYSSLQIFDKISMQEIFEKTRKLVYYTRILFALECQENNEKILIVTPCVDSGAQLSFAFKHLKKEFSLADIVDSFMEAGIYVDERQPNIIRMAPTALYNTFLDCHKFVAVLKYVLTKV